MEIKYNTRTWVAAARAVQQHWGLDLPYNTQVGGNRLYDAICSHLDYLAYDAICSHYLATRSVRG